MFLSIAMLSMAMLRIALAQSPSPQFEAGPRFEVASVKASDPKELGGRVQFLPGGRFVVTNCPLSFIVQRVYAVADYELAGLPRWTFEDRFEIRATAATTSTEDQLRQMAQSPLAERFKLQVHHGTKEMSVYLLAPGKKGLKLSTGKDGDGRIGPGGIAAVSPGILEGRKVRIASLVSALARDVDRPILDRTNFDDPFDFRLEWAPDLARSADDNRASLFVALEEQLGLRLKAEKAPIGVLVADRIERPTPN